MWSIDLVSLMIPVAIEVGVQETETNYISTLAALGCLFDPKSGKAFSDGLQKVRDQVRSTQRAARGLNPEEATGEVKTETAADQMLEVLQKMGLKMPVKKTKNLNPQKTKVHKKK